jgi:hypothetical protein
VLKLEDVILRKSVYVDDRGRTRFVQIVRIERRESVETLAEFVERIMEGQN